MPRPSQVHLLVLSLLVAGARLEAQSSPRGPAAIARVVFAAVDAGDLSRVGTFLADSFHLHYQGIPDPIGKADFLEMIRSNYPAFPDMQHDVQQVLPSGDHVTVRLVVHATHKGLYEGVPPTGKQITSGAIHIIRIANGKIVEWWAAEDDLGVLRQIGMIIKPPQSTP
jgi:predicted ester cyclase